MRLQGQPLQILADLVREPGRIVTREELQQQLWNSSTFVDFEHGLNAAMNRLRQVLGDNAENPRYIETIPGRGYRFVAPVQEAASKPVLLMAPAAATQAAESPAPVQPAIAGRRWRPWVIAVAMIASLAAGYLVANRSHTRPALRSVRFGISPPFGYALESGSSRQTFALSPDGSRLAFSAMNASGKFQMFIRDLDGIAPRALANSFGSYNVFWAPDGRSLFLTVGDKVRRSALEDDSYQVVCDTPALMLSGVLIAPNLLLSARSANFVVPASGGTPQPIKQFYPWPQILPDGKHILYTSFDAKTGHHHAQVAKLGEDGTSTDVLETDSRTMYTPSLIRPETGYLVYVREGNIVAHPFDPRTLRIQGEPQAVVSQTYSWNPTGAADFSVSNNGMLAYRRYQSRSQLAWVSRHGEVLSTIGPANVNLKQARLSPDGKRIAAPIFDLRRGVKEMWIIDAHTGAARQAITGRGHVDSPVWSPDSTRLAFSRAYDSPPKLFVRGFRENDADEALPEDYFQWPCDWSPDGRFLAFTNTGIAQIDSELKGDVWLIDMERGRKVIPLIQTPFHEAEPAFSPDGRWLAFISNESGQAEVYMQAFEAGESPRLVGERLLVSKRGASNLRWRRDGKELFYLAFDGRLYVVPIALGPKPKIGKPSALFSIGMEARAAVHGSLGFDVSHDGQRLLVPIVTSTEQTEIVVIQNWEAALQQNRAKLN